MPEPPAEITGKDNPGGKALPAPAGAKGSRKGTDQREENRMSEKDRRAFRRREDRREDLEKRLSRMVRLGYRHAPGIREMFRERNLKPGDIRGLEDLSKLPVLSREQVVAMEKERPPFGGFAREDRSFQRIFTSPGPVYEPHLDEGTLWGPGYRAAGIGKGDVVLNAFSYHMVAAGLTFHEGLRASGATVVPSGTSGAEQQVRLIGDLGVTAFTGTPSFLMAVIAKAEENGHDFRRDFRLRKAVFVAEPLRPAVRETLEKKYGIDTYQMYGATEVGDIAYECPEKKGWHLCEDGIVEIVDPATGKAVEPGKLGEVVVTRLNDLFFLFRFGTGDLSSLIDRPCPCGRTSLRLSGIAGRIGDAVKVRGLFIAPSQVHALRERFPGVFVQLEVTRRGDRDHLLVALEAEAPPPDLAKRFQPVFAAICTVRADEIRIVPPGSLADREKPILDRREWN